VKGERSGMLTRVTSEHELVSFDPTSAPACEVDPGDVVSIETSGAILRQLAAGASLDSIDLERANSVTGPVFVRGAEPGDALRIELIEITIEQAWVVWLPGFGPLGSLTEAVQVTEAPIADGRVRLGEQLSVPLAPMIGCIGVAPAVGTMSTVRPVYPTGGNMDLRELSPGAVLRLPVEVPGALLSLGDLHAAMGQGEPAFVAIEAAGDATVRIDVEKRSELKLPRIRSGSETICVGMGRSHPEARASAVQQAFDVLTGTHGMATADAYAYVCARVALRPAGPSGSTVDGLEAALAAVPDPG
jgi:amidase